MKEKEKIKEKIKRDYQLGDNFDSLIDAIIKETSRQYENKIKELENNLWNHKATIQKLQRDNREFEEALESSTKRKLELKQNSIPKQKIRDIIKDWERDVKSDYITKTERTLIVEHIEELEALLQNNFTVKDD